MADHSKPNLLPDPRTLLLYSPESLQLPQTIPTLEELCRKFRLFASGDLTEEDRQKLLDSLLEQDNMRLENPGDAYDIVSCYINTCADSRYGYGFKFMYNGRCVFLNMNLFIKRLEYDLNRISKVYNVVRYAVVHTSNRCYYVFTIEEESMNYCVKAFYDPENPEQGSYFIRNGNNRVEVEKWDGINSIRRVVDVAVLQKGKFVRSTGRCVIGQGFTVLLDVGKEPFRSCTIPVATISYEFF